MTAKNTGMKSRYYLGHQPRKGGQRWRSILSGLESLGIKERLKVYYPQATNVQKFQVNLINQIARKLTDKSFRTWRVSTSILVERTE